MDHLGPLLGLCRHELGELSRRACSGNTAKAGKWGLQRGIDQTRIDLFVDPLNDFSRGAPRRKDPVPLTGLEILYEITDCGKLRQCLRPGRSRASKGAKPATPHVLYHGTARRED